MALTRFAPLASDWIRIFDHDEAHDVVQVVGVDRQTRILLLTDQLTELVERRVRADRDDVGTRRHDLAHERVAKVHDRTEQPAFVGACRLVIRARRRRFPCILCALAVRESSLGRSHPRRDQGRQRHDQVRDGGKCWKQNLEDALRRAPHNDRRQDLADTHRDQHATAEQHQPAREAALDRLGEQHDGRDEQDAAHHPRWNKELQRILEVGRERDVVALPLGLEPLWKPHQQAERGLDEREEQQPGDHQEEEDRNHLMQGAFRRTE